MEYLKEVQAFAGRFSAVAEEKLARVDGGTYNEFIRFYAKPRTGKAENDNEQRQMGILLDELQRATEAPALLSAAPGTVLHTGAVETDLGPALAHLCVALEKCLFFGAGGVAPDFWDVLRLAGSDGPPVAVIGAPGTIAADNSSISESKVAQGIESREGNDFGVFAQGNAKIQNSCEGGIRGSSSGVLDSRQLSDSVSNLSRVHTGHGRCRAWARGILGLDNASSVVMELQKAAAVATEVRDRAGGTSTSAAVAAAAASLDSRTNDGLSVNVGSYNTTVQEQEGEPGMHHGGDSAISSSEHPVDSAHPDATGGVCGRGRVSVRATAHLNTTDEVENDFLDEPSSSTSDTPPVRPDALPLWLRPGLQSKAVLDGICRCLMEFRSRLDERGLSLRLSLDHSWFDNENVAANTIYTWPRFPRNRLRCYVRGAGLAASDGEYVASADHSSNSDDDTGEKSNSLVLTGPNGCQIYRQVCWTDEDDDVRMVDAKTSSAAATATVGAPATADVGESTVLGETNQGAECVAIDASEAPPEKPSIADAVAAVPATTVTAAPCVPCWCIMVPILQPGAEKRIAYYGQGDGTLPPSRGWRVTEMTDMPAPTLVFGTGNSGGVDYQDVDHQGRPETGGSNHSSEASFKPAVIACGRGAAAAAAGTASHSMIPASAPSIHRDSASARRATVLHPRVGVGNEPAAADASVGEEDTGVCSGIRATVTRRVLGKIRKRRRPAETDGANRSGPSGKFHEGSSTSVGRIPRKSRAILQNDDPVCADGGRAVRPDAGGGSAVTNGGEVGLASGFARLPSILNDNDGDEDCGTADVTAFKAERWRLPEPSGELLLRAERTRQQVLRLAEEQAFAIATRRDELLEQLAVADTSYRELLEESTTVTVENMLAARPGLQEEVEAETAVERKAQLATESRIGNRENAVAEQTVASLEQLVAEKAEEIRLRSLDEESRKDHGSGSSTGGVVGVGSGGIGKGAGDQMGAAVAVSHLNKETLGWPWPVAWLSAPRAPVVAVDTPMESFMSPEMLEFARSGGSDVDGSGREDDEKEGVEAPPFSIEVAAVEVADAEDADAAHIEYVLRVTYREVCPPLATQLHNTQPDRRGGVGGERTVSVSSATEDGWPLALGEDPHANQLQEVAAASRGLTQRTRVLSKRLNSLCALHPRLMWELEDEGRRVVTPTSREARGGGEGEQDMTGVANSSSVRETEMAKPPAFPDPFELGTLEESVLRVHRDKLTPRFKANSPIRKLSAKIGGYLSNLLHFLGLLETTGEASLRARLARALNEALSTCDKSGRKRRRADLILCMRTWDDPGGKLGSWVDDEARLRIQNRRCMGCGCTIAAEFLGIKKDYTPCRFANGLFCRRLCHEEGRRVIPHRAIHHWDFVLHRVSKPATAFLDATRFLPTIDLAEVAPHLFHHNHDLRRVRMRRTQLHLLRRVIMFPPEQECAAGARLLEKFLRRRMHLAVDPGLYSVEDLMGVKKGVLVDLLDDVVDILLAHVANECEACKAASARSCSICQARDRIYPFQLSTVTRCGNCDSLFHFRCVLGKAERVTPSETSRRGTDVGAVNKTFVCPECKLPTLFCP